MAPLIDVIFILLIFFAVSTTFVLQQRGIDLKLPEAATVTDAPKGVTVSIDENRHVYLDQSRIDMGGLKEKIGELMTQNPKLEVILQSHEDIPYNQVMQVLDTVRQGGCYAIILEAKEQQIR